MRKTILSAALITAVATGSYLGFNATSTNSEQLSDIMLDNIEALAGNESNNTESLSGSPCYNSGKFDIEYPEAVVCGNPCVRQNHDPGFWSSTSYCP